MYYGGDPASIVYPLGTSEKVKEVKIFLIKAYIRSCIDTVLKF